MLQTVDKYRKDGEMLADARVTENGVWNVLRLLKSIDFVSVMRTGWHRPM
jgi:hypothetical protein